MNIFDILLGTLGIAILAIVATVILEAVITTLVIGGIAMVIVGILLFGIDISTPVDSQFAD